MPLTHLQGMLRNVIDMASDGWTPSGHNGRHGKASIKKEHEMVRAVPCLVLF
ncbi:MAG TPA: hypothetical protein VF359_06195 [Anaerolineales bacterium]